VAARITEEIGNPMMREHIVPLLDGPNHRGQTPFGVRPLAPSGA
jgi:hypothetical protein